MKVKDLVKALLECDQEKTVFMWQDYDIAKINEVDELTDRVDLNLCLDARQKQIKKLIMEETV